MITNNDEHFFKLIIELIVKIKNDGAKKKIEKKLYLVRCVNRNTSLHEDHRDFGITCRGSYVHEGAPVLLGRKT